MRPIEIFCLIALSPWLALRWWQDLWLKPPATAPAPALRPSAEIISFPRATTRRAG